MIPVDEVFREIHRPGQSDDLQGRFGGWQYRMEILQQKAGTRGCATRMSRIAADMEFERTRTF